MGLYTVSDKTRSGASRLHVLTMYRSEKFELGREPFRDNKSLALDKSGIVGPFKQFNPTSAQLRCDLSAATNSSTRSTSSNARVGGDTRTQSTAINFLWSSRDNRKGRHTLCVPPAASDSGRQVTVPPLARHPTSIAQGIYRMLVYYPVWDISFDVAYIFTLGSVVWIINAFFVFLPLLRPSTEFSGELYYGGGITAFIGASVFEVGSILLMLEAINEDRSGCFGWILKQEIKDYEKDISAAFESRRPWILPEETTCTHHHRNKRRLIGPPEDSLQSVEWSWVPDIRALREHYLHDIGFLACCFQMAGASIFWIAGLTALPGIFNHLSPAALDVVYWTPQVIGGTGFIISGILFMIETQQRWWKPALGTLGWHIGFWNMVGGVGFTLCPAFGFDPSSWAQYQSSCSTFWGSWAFLVGSVLQWYESLDKFPVVERPRPVPS